MKKTRPVEHIGSVLNDFLSQRGYLTPCREQQVMFDWALIVGDTIAGETRCERVEDGVAYVRVLSAPWRQELSYLKRRILDAVHRRTACTTVTDIVFF